MAETGAQNGRYVVADPHARPWEEVLGLLHSQQEGLTTAEAAHRLDVVGPNRLPAPGKDGPVKRFLRHFRDLLIYILLIAALATALLGHWIDTAVILSVVIVNAIVGFVQEGKAERALESIRKMLSSTAQVRRDGRWVSHDAGQLVPGDVVRLRPGDRVPADIRLTTAAGLRIDEAALTGESSPAGKRPAQAESGAGIGDRHCMAWSGTLVVSGTGAGVVTATGTATEIGRINRMIAAVETLATPLTRQMAKFGKLLSVAITAMAAGIWLFGWLVHGYPQGELFLAAVGFAVAAIPEGLPAILTITLALGVQRMAARNAIVRKLGSVETLGSVTVVCSDKTGTLTRNEMTVRVAVTAGGTHDVSGTGYQPAGTVTLGGNQVSGTGYPCLWRMAMAMAVCNDAEVSEHEGQWRVAGEPTEGALRTFARKAGLEWTGHTRLASVPFDSGNKFMATLDRLPDGGCRIHMKGAPDRLLGRCAHELAPDGSPVPLRREFWERHIDGLGAAGLRVLASASRDCPAETTTIEPADLAHGMVFLGLVGIVDPPREEAIRAIETCRRAGIRVKMITGDHAGTAVAIGREMGIGGDHPAVTGDQLEAATDAELETLVRSADIFARTSPGHKLRIVTALQANQEVVAMTGDGVNDAPALKRADVGVAMGIKGTEAAKEAAEIVLTDDNFTSIEAAVGEGRTIYDNLRKAILFIIPTNGAEGFVILAAVIFGLTLPVTPVQLLWVNLVTAVTLALAMAFEPAEPGVMTRRPRKPGAPILDAVFLWRIGFVSVLVGGATLWVFLADQKLEDPVALSRTLAVNTLVFGEIFYLFNARFLRSSSLHLSTLFTNRVAWLAVGAVILLQLAFVYVPFMQTLFGTVPMNPGHWALVAGIGLAVFLIVEAEKALIRIFVREG